jgi:chitin disaccharide deacetylase
MSALRRIWLCADDYGMAPGINRAIRQLILRGRLNATSIMTAAHYLRDDEVGDLALLNAGRKRALLGLHVTLTAPFKPLTQDFAPLRDGAFPSNLDVLQLGMRRGLTQVALYREIVAQIDAFIHIFGRAPDYLDGHQHVHLFPVVRDAFLQAVREKAPNARVRQCGRPRGAKPVTDVKGLFLDLLSVRMRSKARRLGITFNPAFNGAYDFTPNADFTRLFPRFLTGMPDGGLVMCHPGFVDPALKSLDSLTDLREREFAYLESDAFPAVLKSHGYELADASGGEKTVT